MTTAAGPTPKRKLIEVSLPLEAISEAAQTEKNRKVGKPQNLHHWWSRKTVTAGRAFLLGQLLNDPSSDPAAFPTPAAQAVERERLHRLIIRAIDWDRMSDAPLLAELLEEIDHHTNGSHPVICDPFLGGGSLLLEAQRLGLSGVGSDLNPVAVLLSRALLEIPPKFAGLAPVFPGAADTEIGAWTGAEGLASDVRLYGAWMRNVAAERLGDHYPAAGHGDSMSRRVLAWVWARTVVCPNPACRIELPLASKWSLAKKRGREASIVPLVVPDPLAPSGQRVQFEISHGTPGGPTTGTISGRRGAICLACSAVVGMDYIKSEGMAGRMGAVLTAVVAEGHRRREYLPPTPEHQAAAVLSFTPSGPSQELGFDPRNLWTPQYGLTTFSDLFSGRQLLAMMTFSDLVSEAREQALGDALAAGLSKSPRLSEGGTGADAYADAVAVYLALAVSRLADWSNSLCSWESSGEVSQHLFTGQKIGMSWDFSEANVLGVGNSGSFQACVAAIADPLARRGLGVSVPVQAADARNLRHTHVVINTDPPYYDNIDYGDLSDFYYVWHRRSLSEIYPDLYRTISVPKANEIVAHPYRAGGTAQADAQFEQAFREVFANMHHTQDPAFPVVVYYASKQSERVRKGEISSSWSSVLEGLIGAGWQVTATWPVRSENASRAVAQGVNSMASSIVLTLRARPTSAETIDRRGFIAALEAELPDAIHDLQAGSISPVDLQQAAVGSGIAIFSRYGRVLEADGSTMAVRSALERINEILDQVLNEQEGDFDASSRFAIAWYRQYGYAVGKFGDADNLARARNTSVDLLDRDGILTSRANSVQLIRPAHLPWDYDVNKDSHTSSWEALHHLIKVLERDGIAPAGDFLQAALARPDGAVVADLVKELAHLLFRIAEAEGATKDALSFNALVTSWPEILDVARAERPFSGVAQSAFDFDEEGV